MRNNEEHYLPDFDQLDKLESRLSNANNNASTSNFASNPNSSSSSGGGVVASGSFRDKEKSCNCRKSGCLKLYCDCFGLGQYCSARCTCVSCLNNQLNEHRRSKAVIATIERDPSAFRPKVVSKEIEKAHKKGCNCKKSGCLKKYCECYQAGIVCSDKCKCTDCQNTENNNNNNGNNNGNNGNNKNTQNLSNKRTLGGNENKIITLSSLSPVKSENNNFNSSNNNSRVSSAVKEIFTNPPHPIDTKQICESMLDELSLACSRGFSLIHGSALFRSSVVCAFKSAVDAALARAIGTGANNSVKSVGNGGNSVKSIGIGIGGNIASHTLAQSSSGARRETENAFNDEPSGKRVRINTQENTEENTEENMEQIEKMSSGDAVSDDDIKIDSFFSQSQN